MPTAPAANAADTASPEVAAEDVQTDTGIAGAEEAASTESPAEQQAAAVEEQLGGDGTKEPEGPKKYKLGEKEWDESELQEAIRISEKRRDHTAAANKRFEAASKIQREAEAKSAALQKQLDALDKDPFALHRARGMTQEQIDQLTYQYLQRRTEEAELAKARPDEYAAQQRLAQLRQEAETVANQKAQQEEWLAEQHHNQERAKHEAVIEEQLPAAVEKVGLKGVPEAGYLTQMFVVQQLQAGGEPDFETAAETAKDLLHQAAKSYLANLPPETLEREFPDLAKSLRTASVARVAKAPVVKPGPATPRQAAKPGVMEMDGAEYFRRLKHGMPLDGQ